MSACFGIVHLDGRPIDAFCLQQMDNAMAYWGQDGGGLYTAGPVGLGSRLLKITTEDQAEQQPLAAGPIVLIAHSRLDDRDGLCRKLQVRNSPDIADSRLIVLAYRKYGLNCFQHLLGDWVFALWDSAARQLVLARDASGSTGMYWHQGKKAIVFSTGMKGILASSLYEAAPDLDFLAGVLTVFYDPAKEEISAYKNVQRLLPGRYLVANDRGVRVDRWWRPEDLPPLHFSNTEAYYEAFLELYNDAVAQRLRVHDGDVAISLSGGLDSGSTAALAAPQLANQGKRLTAYVHRPLYEPTWANERQVGDELPFAQQTADHVGNIDIIPLSTGHISIIDGMRDSIRWHDSPIHGAVNFFWMYDVMAQSRANGAKVLLFAQGGNATVSYTGSGNLLPELLRGQLGRAFQALRNDQVGLYLAIKRRLLKPLLLPALESYRLRTGLRDPEPWEAYSAINPQFAREAWLLERMRAANFDPHFSFVSTQRESDFRLGWAGSNSRIYEIWMEAGATHGMALLDPTRDRRLIEFCWRLPDPIFWGEHGQKRALIRSGMANQLPKSVRYSPVRGLQSADVFGRLKREQHVLSHVLDEIQKNPLAAHCLDTDKMQKELSLLRESADLTPIQVSRMQHVLVRAMQSGMFLLSATS